jgi:hypothetical protein
MISVLKENSISTFFESIPFDSKSDVNIGVEGYSMYENKGIKFSILEYRDPETQTSPFCNNLASHLKSWNDCHALFQAMDN